MFMPKKERIRKRASHCALLHGSILVMELFSLMYIVVEFITPWILVSFISVLTSYSLAFTLDFANFKTQASINSMTKPVRGIMKDGQINLYSFLEDSLIHHTSMFRNSRLKLTLDMIITRKWKWKYPDI